MRFGSICSGIEAASVAWKPLGWEAAWFAEVDIAASGVLAHRFGATAPVHPLPGSEAKLKRVQWGDQITNWGDMTKLPEAVRSGAAEAPDVLCGGPPCQSYSIAGRRAGLADDRGQLTLSFVELADAIDERRAARGEQPCIVFFENVLGILSSKDNAFGCFLADLAGEDLPLEPAGKRWTNAGVVLGPQRAVAWRVMDAQYAGLAQRRQRVFVVASARAGFDPAAVLFEFEGVRRDSAPSRETGQDVAGTLAARTDGGGFPGTDEACSGYVQPVEPSGVIAMAHGQGGAEISEERCPTLTCNHEAPIAAIPILEAGARTGVSTTDVRAGIGIGIGTDGDPMFTLQAGKQHGVAVFDPNQITSPTNASRPTPELCHTLPATPNGPIAFSCKDYGADATNDLASTMRAMGHDGSHANAGGQLAVCIHGTQDPIIGVEHAHALGRNSGQENAVCVTGEITHTPVRKCSVEGCGEKVHAHGMCASHAHRLRRHGDPLAGRVKEGEPLAFLKAAVCSETDECIIWPYAKLVTGYGTIQLGGKTTRVHRASCQMAHGDPEWEALDCAHSCGVRLCVNPRHLRWTTREGNMRDAIKHGTTTRGERHAHHVLTETDVICIDERLSCRDTHQSIADDFGVSRNTITDIAKGKNWAWLTGRGQPIVPDTTMAVRRLMPVECERLQGFPDGWALVPTSKVSKKGQWDARMDTKGNFVEIDGEMWNVSADGPRYKQLGNSWAVPCVRWIGERIAAHIAELDADMGKSTSEEQDPFLTWLLAA